MQHRARGIAGLLLIAAGLTGLVLYAVYAGGYQAGPWSTPWGMWGMLGGMRGGMMGDPFRSNVNPLTMDEAVSAAQTYLAPLRNPGLGMNEVMEFEDNFYVVVFEKSTGIGAFELLVDRYTGSVYPEPGPNMMWNTKYGMMGRLGRTATVSTPVGLEQAKRYAQEFLDNNIPGASVEDVHIFYGYYTIHVARDGRVYGMLGVNGYTGQVWYHAWHGAFIAEEEIAER